MSEQTKIEWCDSTFNPWIGCTKVGPGCDHCYAEKATPSRTLGVVWGPKSERHRTSSGNWALPLRWEREHEAFFAQHGRRRRVFCASLADVFDNQVDPAWRLDLFRLIYDTPHLDWLLVTKRIGNVAQMTMKANVDLFFKNEGFAHGLPANVWLGITVVNQEEADRDIPKLLAVPARVRFLSMEPLLGPVDLTRLRPTIFAATANALTGKWKWDDGPRKQETPPLDWVIVGGESGPKARPMHPDWARSLRDQCAAAGVPFLFKQWGEWKPISQMGGGESGKLYVSKVKAKPDEDQAVLDDIWGRRCSVPYTVVHLDGSTHDILEPNAWITGAMQTFQTGKKAAGRLLDGVEHNGFPEVAP